MYWNRLLAAAILLLYTAGCGMTDDLMPSGEDKRGGSSVRPEEGASAPGFSMKDIHGATHTLGDELAGRRGVVIYFAMWCPICDSHMQNMLRGPVKNNPDVAFLIVDYVSGSVEASYDSAMAGGYARSAFTILVDERQEVLKSYGATMGTTVVVDGAGIIRMIGEYKGAAGMEEVLARL